MTASYVAIFRLRPARRLLYALGAACLSFGMVSLTVLLSVERATGSYQDGGFAVAAYAATAGVSAPIRGRLVDRRGARRWLPLLASGYASAFVLLDVLGHGGASAWLLIAASAVAGASTPPLFSAARAVWPQAVEPVLLRRGYALMSLLSDVGQVVGPVIAGALFLVSGWLPPLVCAGAGLAGALLSLPTRHPSRYTHDPQPMPRLLGGRALIALLGISVLLGVSQGLVQVAVPGAAGRWHHASLSGFLLGAFALGSVIGGVWFGGRHWRAPVLDRYLTAIFCLGLLLAPAALAHGVWLLAPLLLLAGLAFGPATVSMFEALDVVAPGSGAEALAWVTTAEASGSGAGSALAGVLTVRVGSAVPFLLASGLLVAPSGLPRSPRVDGGTRAGAEAARTGTKITREPPAAVRHHGAVSEPSASTPGSPFRELEPGIRMPMLGLGVWQLPDGKETENAVEWALEAGYRHVDTAQLYRNERSVGAALRRSGLRREELFVTTKWLPMLGGPKRELRRSLERLQLDYVDLYLIHWPLAGRVTTSWRAFELLHERGQARAIGVSNFGEDRLGRLIARSGRRPAVNQVRFSPLHFSAELLAYCDAQGVVVEAYSPLEQGRALDHPLIGEIAERLGRTPAQVMLRWAIQHNVVVIPKSGRQDRIRSNAQIFDFELSPEDVRLLDGLGSATTAA